MNRGAVPTYPEYKKQYLSGGDGNHVKIVAGDGDLVLVSSALNDATFLHRDAPSELLPNEVTDLKDSVLAGGTISNVVVDGKMGIHKLHLVLRARVSAYEKAREWGGSAISKATRTMAIRKNEPDNNC